MTWLINFLNIAISDKFTGSIQINFSFGGITNVTKTESFKPSITNKVI